MPTCIGQTSTPAFSMTLDWNLYPNAEVPLCKHISYCHWLLYQCICLCKAINPDNGEKSSPGGGALLYIKVTRVCVRKAPIRTNV